MANVTQLQCAYRGKGEYRCFIGPDNVGSIHIVHGWYYPQATNNGVTRTNIGMRSMEAARAWILMTLRSMGRAK